MNAPQSNRKKQHCNECSRDTWHAVLWVQKDEGTDDEGPHAVSGGIEHSALQCCGCDSICFEINAWSSENVEPDGRLAIDTQVYPPKTVRDKPHWYGALWLESLFEQKPFLRLLDEVYIALQNDCPSLAVMGIRALLEAIMIESCGDQRSFGANLDKFQELGYISVVQRQAIEPVLEAGHAVIHRSFEPSPKQALVALDITENIIESVFVATGKAGALRDKVPPRHGKS